MIDIENSEQQKALLENHFGFRETPFGVTPDPRFFYGNPQYLEGLSTLAYGIQGKKGFLLLTGEIGTGKTILLRKLIRHLESSVQFVFVSTSHLTSYGLVELIIQELGINKTDKNRLDMIHELREYLIERQSRGNTVALLVDEAQNLSDEALEGLCGLSNLETESEKLLQIVLVGQPELTIKLGKPSLRRIKQRIAIHYRLYALQTSAEIEHYIRHRLQVAGYDGPEIFAKEAIEAVWFYSSGTPRLVNILCDNSLAMAYVAGKKRVSAYMIMKAATALLLDRGHEAPKVRATELGLTRTRAAGSKPAARRSETNAPEPRTDMAVEEPAVSTNTPPQVPRFEPLEASEPVENAAVSPHFLDDMTRAATHALGPMAQRVVEDQISALGESRHSFPQIKLGKLIELVSREILNETMRARFENTMRREIAGMKTL